MNRQFINLLQNNLIDTTLVDVYRVLDLCCFKFEGDKQSYSLHIQCTWRLTVNKIILLAIGDLYASESNNKIKFDYSRNLIPTKLKVISVNISEFGDIKITLLNSVNKEQWVLSTFSDSSVNEELWRFIEVDSNKNHLVCYPSKIQVE